MWVMRYCGTMNLYGAIDIKATSFSENSSLQKLIDLVKVDDENQAPTQRFGDKGQLVGFNCINHYYCSMCCNRQY